ncbi:MAG: hypothetical protein ACRDFX_12595 [Chloroflexota bacterium]
MNGNTSANASGTMAHAGVSTGANETMLARSEASGVNRAMATDDSHPAGSDRSSNEGARLAGTANHATEGTDTGVHRCHRLAGGRREGGRSATADGRTRQPQHTNYRQEARNADSLHSTTSRPI